MERIISIKAVLRKLFSQWKIAVILACLALVVSLFMVLLNMRATESTGIYDMSFYVYIDSTKALTSDEIIYMEWHIVSIKNMILEDQEINRLIKARLEFLGIYSSTAGNETELSRVFYVDTKVARADNIYKATFTVSCYTSEANAAVQALEYYKSLVNDYVTNTIVELGYFDEHREVKLVGLTEPSYNRVRRYSETLKYFGFSFAVAFGAYIAFCAVLYFYGDRFNCPEEFCANISVPVLTKTAQGGSGSKEAATRLAALYADKTVVVGAVSLSKDHAKALVAVGECLTQNSYKTLVVNLRPQSADLSKQEPVATQMDISVEGLTAVLTPSDTGADVLNLAGAVGYDGGIKQKDYCAFVDNLRQIGEKYSYDYIILALKNDAEGREYLRLAALSDYLVYELDLERESRRRIIECFTDAAWLKSVVAGVLLEKPTFNAYL